MKNVNNLLNEESIRPLDMFCWLLLYPKFHSKTSRRILCKQYNVANVTNVLQKHCSVFFAIIFSESLSIKLYNDIPPGRIYFSLTPLSRVSRMASFSIGTIIWTPSLHMYVHAGFVCGCTVGEGIYSINLGVILYHVSCRLYILESNSFWYQKERLILICYRLLQLPVVFVD